MAYRRTVTAGGSQYARRDVRRSRARERCHDHFSTGRRDKPAVHQVAAAGGASSVNNPEWSSSPPPSRTSRSSCAATTSNDGTTAPTSRAASSTMRASLACSRARNPGSKVRSSMHFGSRIVFDGEGHMFITVAGFAIAFGILLMIYNLFNSAEVGKLAGLPGEVVDRARAILATHVVEHLPVEVLFAFFRQASRVLRSGGVLMIETPNAESIAVSASEFWRDPTHLAPRHPAALVLLGRESGFDVEEARAVHPLPAGTALQSSPEDPPAVRRVVEAINERVFGPQDLRLILSKR